MTDEAFDIVNGFLVWFFKKGRKRELVPINREMAHMSGLY